MKSLDDELVPDNLKHCLNVLKNDGDSINLNNPLSHKEISILSRQTGVEFASVTIGGENILIRGNETSTSISKEIFDEMKKTRGILDCHSHPYIGDVRPSNADLKVAKQIDWQDKFTIISVDGKVSVYTENGVISVTTVSNIISDNEKEILNEVFKKVK